MARSIETRLARLEAPAGDPARSYAMLKALHEVLSRMDDAPIPSDAELWAMARADVRPNYTAALQAVWDEET